MKRVDSDVTDWAHALDPKTMMHYESAWGPGWQLLEERIDEDYVGDAGVDRHHVYVWGAQYIDDIIARRVDTNPASQDGYEQTWFHLTDAQFSTVAIINEDAVIAERVTYTAYGQARHHWLADVDGDGDHDTDDRDLVSALRGKSIGDAGYRAEADLDRNGVINNADLAIVNLSFGPQYGRAALPDGVLSSADVDNTIGYCGYVFDREVETYLVRNRVYSPVLGRWLQQDPLGYVDGMNVYVFVQSDPIRKVDPFGLAFYAIGGTWERAKDQANPWWFHQETKEVPSRYFRGPGFTLGAKDPIGAAHGRDSHTIRDRVYKQICKDFCAAKKKCEEFTINMTGWSRGAVIAVGVAERLNDDGCKCGGFLGIGGERHKPVGVNWIGLFDAVSMVLPDIHRPRFPATVPFNVRKFAHAIKTEIQLIFPTVLYGWNERVFTRYDGTSTSHTDIGNSKTLGNNDAYNWIKSEAIAAGVSF